MSDSIARPVDGQVVARSWRHRLFGDLGIAFFGYALRFITPLILYPFLTRRFGLDAFGLYATAYSAALVVSVLFEYGFPLSATRDVAATSDRDVRGTISSGVVTARIMLLPIVVSIGVLLALVNAPMWANPTVAGAAVVLGVGQGAAATWYFQGVGRIGVAVVLELVAQVLGMLAIVAFVWSADDVFRALALQAVAVWLVVVIGHYLMFRQVPFSWTGSKGGWTALRAGFPLFLSRSSVMVFTSASVFLLGALGGPAQAGIYGVAERVFAAATVLFRPLSAVLMPRVSALLQSDRAAAFRLVRLDLFATVAVFGLGALFLALLSPIIVPAIFGPNFTEATPVLQIMCAMVPIIAMSQVIGNHLMVPLRLDSKISMVIAFGALLNVGLAVFLVPQGGAIGMATARLVTEVVVTMGYFFFVRQYVRELVPVRGT